MDNKMTPERIKKLREAMGLTQERFAHALGTSVTVVNRWENDKSKPRTMAIKLLMQMEEKAVAMGRM